MNPTFLVPVVNYQGPGKAHHLLGWNWSNGPWKPRVSFYSPGRTNFKPKRGPIKEPPWDFRNCCINPIFGLGKGTVGLGRPPWKPGGPSGEPKLEETTGAHGLVGNRKPVISRRPRKVGSLTSNPFFQPWDFPHFPIWAHNGFYLPNC